MSANRRTVIMKNLLQMSAVAACVLSLSACLTVGSEYEPPETEVYQDSWIAGELAVLAPGEVPRSDWWTSFDDALLTALIEDARARNPSIDEAAANVANAQAALGAARAARLPMGALNASVVRQKQSAASLGANVPFEFEAQTLYSAGSELSWQADLFGRTANSIAQADAALGGREAIAADAARAILAETARAYLTLRELDARILVNDSNVERQEDVLALTVRLREAGEVADIDVERQTNLVQTTKAAISALKAARAQTVTGLARLTGRTLPDFYEAYPALQPGGTETLDAVQAFGPIEIGEPKDLLRRRPDIRAAERQLAAATYRVGIETADLYPSLKVSGQANYQAGEVGELFSADALGYNFGPRLSWGIFNLPLTRAQIEQAEADVEAARANFEGTVLDALTEADAALLAYNYAVEETAFRTGAFNAAKRARDLTEIRYREGAESLLSLIDAQRQTLSAEDAEIQARYEALRRRVGIYAAFGG
ncbi:TolC family protein [Henriciella barbarensis]|uniref:TolC family protein n=2 Tax=Henriciella barbarensis TaxID=86342 RepID=A0A399QW34_9PROT|nr:TolC family protein [Henriciella barbarensis]